MSQEFDIEDIKRRMEGAVSSFQGDLGGLRTGRASPSLLEPITIDAYGSQMPINQVANITVPEPRMLSVSVWDKSMVSAIEKAIRESTLGLNPMTDGTTIRVPLPELNEERRRELAKIAHQYAENARIAVRHVRRDGMETLKRLEKDGEISQDDSRTKSDDVQKQTDQTISRIDSLLAEKESEIMQV
ncbi:ribosome recycling factor [Oricola nitratireducens]|jgi:ribosome recycling factor|uniref:ribosome recycling factor n=1 Tax=Oricola nitratireducens TaxID=2775868 RepID=UPI001867EEB2|nr:ribosome recycling factor [Oricola nitratireducens]